MKNNSMLKGTALGAGITAAAIGAYFIFGSKDAKNNRKKVKSWMLKAKGEILEQLENISELSEKTYHQIVKEVSEKYQELKNIDKKEVAEFIEELKGHWKNIAKEMGV